MWTKLVSWFASLIIPAWLPILAAACISGGIAWKIQGWRMDSMKAEYLQAEIKATEQARKQEQDWNMRFQTAINKGVEREKTYRTHAANARNAADGLRNKLDTIKRNLPDVAEAACRERASAIATVLQNCTAEYQRMGESADRLLNDRTTLQEAWPH